MGFSEDLATVKAAPRPTDDVDVTLNGKLYTLRFTQMDGLEWASAVDRHPARPGILIDSRYGYNLRQLVKTVAPKCGVLLSDGAEVALRVDPPTDPSVKNGPPRVDEWADLFKALDGHAVQRICDAVWALNEWTPQQAVADAKKALTVSGRKSA